MLAKVSLSEAISSAKKTGITQDEADKVVEQMIRDGIIFMQEDAKGPSF